MKQEKSKIPFMFKILKIFGPVLLIASIVMIILGITFHIIALFSVGSFILVLSFGMTVLGFLPSVSKASINMTKYIFDENVDDFKEMSSTIAEINVEAIKKTESNCDKSVFSNKCSCCGARIEENENYCSYCGNKLK